MFVMYSNYTEKMITQRRRAEGKDDDENKSDL